jgi:hypothetical protein
MWPVTCRHSLAVLVHQSSSLPRALVQQPGCQSCCGAWLARTARAAGSSSLQQGNSTCEPHTALKHGIPATYCMGCDAPAHRPGCAAAGPHLEASSSSPPALGRQPVVEPCKGVIRGSRHVGVSLQHQLLRCLGQHARPAWRTSLSAPPHMNSHCACTHHAVVQRAARHIIPLQALLSTQH